MSIIIIINYTTKHVIKTILAYATQKYFVKQHNDVLFLDEIQNTVPDTPIHPLHILRYERNSSSDVITQPNHKAKHLLST